MSKMPKDKQLAQHMKGQDIYIVSINKVLLEHDRITCFYLLRGCFPTAITGLDG